jgi:hypothetical protein
MVADMVIESSEQGKQLAESGSAKGGRARASVLTREERSEIARQAVRARWAKAGKLKAPDQSQPQAQLQPAVGVTVKEAKPSGPFSMFRGELQLGPMKLECHVLNDFRRVWAVPAA